jgi:hypothetical protein
MQSNVFLQNHFWQPKTKMSVSQAVNSFVIGVAANLFEQALVIVAEKIFSVLNLQKNL